MATNQQLHFDWGGSAANDPSRVFRDAQLPDARDAQSHATGQGAMPQNTSTSIHLPWNFAETFPPPLPEAVAAGKLGEEQLTPEQNASIHQEHAAELLGLLEQLEAVENAKRTGVDPRNGKTPRTAQTRERLARYLEAAPAEIMREFDGLMDVYEDAYGSDAANSFRQAIEARHKNIPIHVVSLPESEGEGSAGDSTPAESDNVTQETPEYEVSRDMPIAAPLPEAVERKAFGEDEFGPIEPSVEEVKELTGHIVMRMQEALDRLEELDDSLANGNGSSRDSLVREKDCALSAFQSSIGLYIEDFGEEAGRRLENWVKNNRGHVRARYDPGHPWRYYREGDAQPPVPVEQIEPAHVGDAWLGKLPKDRKKRMEKFSQMLADQTKQLDDDKARYLDLISRGPAALSDYDRHIAHNGNDELAWASAIALKHNHISNGLGRIEWLRMHGCVGVPNGSARRETGE